MAADQKRFRLGWTRDGPQKSALFKLPAEIMRMILAEVSNERNRGQRNITNCAKTCRELCEHAEGLLWTNVPHLKLNNFDQGKGNSLINDITGIQENEARGRQAVLGPLSQTKALVLHIDDKDYSRSPTIIDANMICLGNNYPTSQNLEVLTTTPQTVFFNATQYNAYAEILSNKERLQLVYLPALGPSPHLQERFTIAACIQAHAPPNLTTKTVDRAYDVFIEDGAYTPYGSRIAPDEKNIYQVSLFASRRTDGFSITKFCDTMGYRENTAVTCLRFYNFARVAGLRFWNLVTLSKIELYDCSAVHHLLPTIAKEAKALTRFALAYSGYPKNGKMPVLTAASGKNICKILESNGRMEDLSICVGYITNLTTDQLLSSLPATLKRLSLVRTSSDIIKPQHYATVAQRCPELEGIGTSMEWIPMVECTNFTRSTVSDIKLMVDNLFAMSKLRYIGIIRLGDINLNHPLDLAKHIFRIASKRDDDLSIILSLHCRQRAYANTERRTAGNHFTTTRQGQTVKFTPSQRDVVSTLRFLAAVFGRNMTEVAAADGVRYHFGGSNGLETDIGWAPSDVSLVQA